MSHPASIAEVIAAEGGEVTFGRFMELALTHPSLGYYSRVDRLLGHRGDFSTAPSLSPFFNRTVARLVTELLDAALATEDDNRPLSARLSVVEFGGGEGHLAAAIVGQWSEARPELRGRVAYRILEVGERLRARQAEAVGGAMADGWDIGWGATLEEVCVGTMPVVMVGNEFVDTLPAHLVRVSGGEIAEGYVRATPAGVLEQIWGPMSEVTSAEVRFLFGTADARHLENLTADGVIEVFPALTALFQQMAELMPAGSLVHIDYGGWQPGVAEPPEGHRLDEGLRRRRTVRGYFKRQMAPDPLARAGRQDLTADVDFGALDLHGRQHGFETVVFTNLASFLRAGGAEDELETLGACGFAADPMESDRQATVLRHLLDESDLGGAFKVMVQVKE